MELNERLKEARKKNNFTQQEVAEILNISRTTVSSWEVGRTIPSLNYIIDISNIYNISLDILLKEDISVRNQVNKDLRLKVLYKRILTIILVLLGLFILLNVIWVIKIKADYKGVSNNFDRGEDAYTLNQDGINYIVSKPKYLSFSNKKELSATSMTNNIKWNFSKNEDFGEVYVKFTDGGESSLLINSKLQFDEQDNNKIGLSFSKSEQKDIDTYLRENKKELQKFYETNYELWNKIKN